MLPLTLYGIGIGIALALIVALFARVTGLDRDRAFFTTVAIVVASYYLPFAAMGDSANTLLVEGIVMSACVAVVGFKSNLWPVVAASSVTECSSAAPRSV